MRTFLTAALIIAAIRLQAQNIPFAERASEISVTRNETVWLSTGFGKTYYTGNPDSGWHFRKSTFEEPYNLDLESQQLKKICFFNGDSAIMIGNINVSGEQKETKKGIYISSNGGRSWELIDLGHGSIINDIFIKQDGRAWMGGASGEIYFSENYGHKWRKLNTPFSSVIGLNSIFMTENGEGVAGSVNNSIYSTRNNWQTIKKIESPHDEMRHIVAGAAPLDEIGKIRVWNHYYVVNQGGHIYFTDTAKINWTHFPIGIADFEVDHKSGKLFAVTKNLKVAWFKDPMEPVYMHKKQLKSLPIDMEIVNGTLFAVDKSLIVYKINSDEFRQFRPHANSN